MTSPSALPDRDLIAWALSVPSDDDLDEIEVVVRPYDGDAVVAAAGAVDDTAYVVLAGSVRTVTSDAQHRVVTIARYERGALVGEQACFQQGHRRDVRIVAAERCLVAAIPGGFLRARRGGPCTGRSRRARPARGVASARGALRHRGRDRGAAGRCRWDRHP